MTAAKKPTPVDGALKPARTKLNDTITTLLRLWDQLDHIEPTQNQTRAAPKSKPPMWLDTISITQEISSKVRQWEPAPGHTTTARLRLIRKRRWRPQDVDDPITPMTRQLENWAKRLNDLINPHKMHIAAPCPACNTQTVHRKDPAGQIVQQPALQIREHGCECMNCHYIWTPDRYQLLAAVLGCPLPEGVLE